MLQQKVERHNTLSAHAATLKTDEQNEKCEQI